MQGGFNTNCRYRGVVFHAQTEDSGIKNPVIVTHLFHQGNVIASCRSNYSDQLGKQDWVEQTRRQMQAQHKAMLRQLIRGEHDVAIEAQGIEMGDLDDVDPASEPGPFSSPSRDRADEHDERSLDGLVLDYWENQSKKD
ncbi:MAG: hypothetical protein CBC48_09315 [bacterium TMED88]|nr:hypothetical protein [Deltaproteobacteria bacterium]OUV31763.1 MAG: hypothetical protein CBC48_09315 [bacterium TMED88]